MPLSDRQQQILQASLKEHMKTARPVASEALAERYNLGLSSASVRNAMTELEDEGYLAQPHTSAGRVPTPKAYQFYVDHFLGEAKVSKHSQEQIREAVRQKTESFEERLKSLAKTMAELCDNTVIVSFARHDVYYTGLSHLFHQPEFAHLESLLNFSEIVDRFDDVVADLFDEVTDEPSILLGNDNPFGADTGVVLTKCYLPERRTGQLVGILGPVRMPYDDNLALLRFAQNLLSTRHA